MRPKQLNGFPIRFIVAPYLFCYKTNQRPQTMIKSLPTSSPHRRGIASYRNTGANLFLYYPVKSKKVRNSLTIRKNGNILTLHGREINSLIAILKKAKKY